MKFNTIIYSKKMIAIKDYYVDIEVLYPTSRSGCIRLFVNYNGPQ